MAAEPVHFSPKQVAKALATSESSVKRWCDQGAIPTLRTSGGHRRITIEGLTEFTRSSGRQLVAPEVLGLPKLAKDRVTEIPGFDDERQTQFRNALAEGDEEACRRLIDDQVQCGVSRAHAAEALITDAMRGIGHAWQCNNLDPYQERRACDICVRLINEIRLALPEIPSQAPVAIGGSLVGDPYHLPTSLVELTLRELGWNATSIGPNLPAESFLQAALDFQPKILWISVSVIDDVERFVREQNRVARGLGSDVSLIIGGRLLTDDIRPRLKYTAFCDSLQHLTELTALISA